MCNKGVGSNSIKCLVCGFWVHKCCSNIKDPLKPNPDLKCKKCRGEISNATGSDIDSVGINSEEIEKRFFCYLGDFIGQLGGCVNATTARIRLEWKKFSELLPILTCNGLSLKTRDYTFNECVHSVLLYASKTWAATQQNVSLLNS